MNKLVYGLSDQGLRRSNNEDCYHVDNERNIFIVADGVGGHNAGEVASRNTVEIVSAHLMAAAAPPGDELARIEEAIRIANRHVHDMACSNAQHRGMATTVDIVSIRDDRLYIGHVGDSRVCLIREKRMEQLTEDHSLIAEQLRKGLITAAEARASKMKNIITRSVGTEAEVDIDLREAVLIDKDILLLCTDGLTDMVPDEQIVSAAIRASGPEEFCRELVFLANEQGGRDNITVIAIYCFK